MKEPDRDQFSSEKSFKTITAGPARQQPAPAPLPPIRKPSLFMMCVYFVFAIGNIGFGIAWGITSLTYLVANQVNGTVIRAIQHPKTNHRVCPEVEYEADGKRFVDRAMVWASSASYRIGDRVRTYYKSENPSSAKIDSFLELWSVPLILTLCGTCLLFGGLFGSR